MRARRPRDSMGKRLGQGIAAQKRAEAKALAEKNKQAGGNQ